MSKSIYRFGKGLSQNEVIGCDLDQINMLGGKGAKLAQMGALGLPVPVGITITTEVCNQYFSQGIDIDDLVDDVLNSYEGLATDIGYMPLVSVRSGARVSMPGMMSTILNVGINNDNMSEWCNRLGIPTAMDCYRRLIFMYSEAVAGIPTEAFEGIKDVQELLERYKDLIGETFPQAIEEQLAGAIEAVFNSWNSERARGYRTMHGYDDSWGTAVNVQQMVFGNANAQSCSGVFFTRDFNTGAEAYIIDWLPNAQGEDVVAGTHTPKTINELQKWNNSIYAQLTDIGRHMEAYYNDMQDIEFTVESGELFILQTRNGKRSALAAFTIANDFFKAGKIDQQELLSRVTAKQYIALHNPSIDPFFDVPPCLTGVGAAGSIVTGIAVLTSADAISCKEDCILVTKETVPSDFPGMAASVGILTRTGGVTSHTAVVARGMDKACVVGAKEVNLNKIAGKQITIDGATGRVWIAQGVPVVEGHIPAFVEEIVSLAMTNDTTFLSVAPESVSKGQTVQVDVAGSLNTQTALVKTLKGLKTSEGSGILNFGKNTSLDEQDQEFLGYFGVGENYDEGTYLIIEKVLSQGQWTSKFKNDWTIYLPTGVSVDYANILRTYGWKVVTVVNCFKAALSVDGYIIMDSNFANQLSRENMKFSDIENLVKAAGREVLELPMATTKARRLFDVLGG